MALVRPTTGDSDVDDFVDAVELLAKQLTCPVCRSLFKNATWSSPCFHAFCDGCLSELFARSNKARCPTCRAFLQKEHLKESPELNGLVAHFKTLQMRNPVTSQASLGLNFSQLAKDMLDHVVQTSEDTAKCETPREANKSQNFPESMPPAIDTNLPTGNESTIAIAKSNLAGTKTDSSVPADFRIRAILSNSASQNLGPARRSQSLSLPVPRFDLNAPGSAESVKQQELDQDTSAAKDLLAVQSNQVFAMTPSKPIMTTATPPTIKVESLFLAAQQQESVQDTTPLGTVPLRRETPPTVKVMSIEAASPEVVIEAKKAGNEVTKIEHEEAATVGKEMNSGIPKENNQVVSGFKKGSMVTVARRMGPGENKPGGVAKVLKVNDDGTLDVYYVVEGNREKRVPRHLVQSGIVIEADSVMGKPNLPPPSEPNEEIMDEVPAKTKPSSKSESKAKHAKNTESKRKGTTKRQRKGETEEAQNENEDDVNQNQEPSATSTKRVKEGENDANASMHGEAPERDGTSEEKHKKLRKSPEPSEQIIPNESNLQAEKADKAQDSSKATPDAVRQLSFSSSGNTPSQTKDASNKPVVVVLTGDMAAKTKKRLRADIGKLKGELIDNPVEADWARITHVVTSVVDGTSSVASKRSAKYLRGLAKGIWIVSVDWLQVSSKEGRFLNEDDFTISSDVSAMQENLKEGGPQRAREAKIQRTTTIPLFKNFFFCFVGEFDAVQPDPVVMALDSGARVLCDCALPWDALDLAEFEKQTKEGERAIIVCQQNRPQRRAAAAASSVAKPNVPMVTNSAVEMVTIQWFWNCFSVYEVLDTAPHRLIGGN